MQKYNYIFLLLLFPLALHAQLEGSYHTNIPSFSSTVYTFQKDGRFSLLNSHCTGQDYGEGRYEVNNGKLELHFEDSKPKNDKSYFLLKDVNESSDSIQYNIDVNYTSSERIQYATILLETNDVKVNFGIASDSDGKALLKVPINIVPTQLRISYFGCDELIIPIENTRSKSIKAYLQDHFTQYIEGGSTWTYNIKKIRKNSFRLKEYGSSYLKYIKRK